MQREQSFLIFYLYGPDFDLKGIADLSSREEINASLDAGWSGRLGDSLIFNGLVQVSVEVPL